jgi:Predicted AAA-ATPase
MLEHFHGLQYADQHQTFYQVCDLLLDYLDIENLLSS